MLFLPFLLLSIAVQAAPSPQDTEAITLCNQYSYWSGSPSSNYEGNNNLWGLSSATSGSQCTYLTSYSSSGLQWHTTWTWAGSPNKVKNVAYSGVRQDVANRKTVASIKSMKASVSWQYTGAEKAKANVAFDIFTAADRGHANTNGDYEVMIWLARFGNPTPIGTLTRTVSVGGFSWNLYIGMNVNMKVFSFVAPSNISTWNGNAKDFFEYLRVHREFPVASQYLLIG
ncbi:glycoside hydrolase family 12 protein [Podospora australis]|uniref:Glycoside hydrolase family 12 protein n=1 Tax=Podospora australis TaxID=1536484 RepID=A0AAN6WST3_9PEZI|nr:glycoside hydrolase family 12 protein [Podospora australis]